VTRSSRALSAACLVPRKEAQGSASSPSIMNSARGSQREADRLTGRVGGGSGACTPRGNSSLKLAGLDVSNAGRQNAAAFPPNSKRGVDTVPRLPASGKQGEVHPWSCEPEIIIPTPRTPEITNEIQKRHKRRVGPGQSSIHWGMKLTETPEAGDGYGIKSNKGENVEQAFRAGQKLGIAEYVQSRGEAIYDTVKKEPLGTSWNRGHVLPEETKQESFPGFGKKLVLDDFDAKETIFTRFVGPEKEEDKARYKRTHGSFDPGEPISRAYDWPKEVTHDVHFKFGKTDSAGNNYSGGGAKSALTMDLEADKTGALCFPRTRVVDRVSENFRQVANDQLGNSRNMLQGRPPVVAGHAFGLKSGHDNTHAGELMRGFYTPAEQRADKDLGKCQLKGRRNFNTKRPFGVPSVRHDLDAPPTHKRSVASATNYGDDHSAFGLIYPQKFGFRGVADNDFFVRREPEQVRSLLEGAGYKLEDQDFRMLWDDAVDAFGDGEQLVSLEVMLNILGHWMSVTGVNPSKTMAETDKTMLSADEGMSMQGAA